jgi:hypothetical protein
MGTSIGNTTSGEGTLSTTGGGFDIGSGGASIIQGTMVVTPGVAPTNYQYDVLSLGDAAGNGYVSYNNSNITCHSSVGVFNRNATFSSAYNSTAQAANCVAHAAQTGFNATQTSSMQIGNSVSALCASNYNANASSSINCRYSASVFPVKYGVNVSNNSVWYSSEFETMTSFWSLDAGAIPTHFRSSDNSYCQNNSTTLTSKATQGLSGPVLTPQPLSFIWSQIWNSIAATPNSNISANPSASYRYVPFSHAVDYSNVVGGTDVTNTTGLSSTGLLALIAKGRVGYASVKPPSYLYQPEDGSGKTGAGGITGNYSVDALITPT